MTRQSVRSVIGILAIMLPGVPAGAGDCFVSPRLEAAAGYENNRFGEVGGGEGAPFWQVSPGLDVMVFGAQTETALFLDYRQTQYSKSEFESKDEATAFVRWRHFGGQNEIGVSGGGGVYRDQALPSDDYTFWQARPYAVHTFEHMPAELTVNGAFRQTLYEVSVYTSTTDRADNRVELRPGLRWHLSHRLTAWAEVYAEHNVSDAPEAEYSGVGGALGCEFRPVARLNLGVWGGAGTRPYMQKVDGVSARDTLVPIGAWATYRLRPWMELFSTVDWESDTSTLDDRDLSWWRAGGGVKLQFEQECGGP